jgi:hypothetical protein
VRRVRTETALFADYYEQSEIWIGKKADVGAHLSVPSVRGDRVLWMCGAHAAPEGATRAVKTSGEVEPCKIKIKAAAPTRKFMAIKELIEAVDALVEEMKDKFPHLSGIYERSDAMFAQYAGEGSRFANHVDNTAGDGRILTIVIYLNPAWTDEMGGALRITQPSIDVIERYKAEKIADRLAAEKSKEKEKVSSSALVVKASDAAGLESSDVVSSPTVTPLPPTPPDVTSDAASSTSSSTSSSSSSSSSNTVKLIDVYPTAGRMAIFFSPLVAHEVLPTFGDRHAITLWYYDKTERLKAIEKARESGSAAETAKV